MNLEAYIGRQIRWSEKTFGPGEADERAAGIVDHIRKECEEVLAEPFDIEEWCDIIILALDGAWRAGHAPFEIALALQEKQDKNMSRKWPDWRKAEPGKAIEHIREEDA